MKDIIKFNERLLTVTGIVLIGFLIISNLIWFKVSEVWVSKERAYQDTIIKLKQKP